MAYRNTITHTQKFCDRTKKATKLTEPQNSKKASEIVHNSKIIEKNDNN